MKNIVPKWIMRAIELSFPPKTFLDCDTIEKSIKLYKFTPQVNREFNPHTALWLATATTSAYNVVCENNATLPAGLTRDSLTLLRADNGSTKQLKVGYIANIEENDPSVNRMVIALAGTSGITQLIKDFKYYQLPLNPNKKDGPQVHSGFLHFVTKQTNEEQVSLLEQVKSQLKQRIQPGKNELYISGHSLGGAAASILTVKLLEYFASKDNVDIILHTFGSPRPGDTLFNDYFHIIASKYPARCICHRVANGEDLVAQTPPPMTPISTLHYQHLSETTSTLNQSTKNNFETYLFTIHNRSITSNHAISTYEDGIKLHGNYNPEEKI